ncbi:MAG: glutathione peroxidase [Mucilaginibacter polytrichastri]|nr:glutathione peroxidase [Mucilaginibacter polytrichastri]
MKLLLLFVALLILPFQDIYTYTFNTIDGKSLSLSKFKGKKILIVNTASECGFTPQYADLEQLYQQYKSSLIIIGFPSNDFGGQEPGDNLQIKDFCQKNYGVTFPISEKVIVSGENAHPLFRYLISQDNPDFSGDIQWNFEKFLIDENGKLIHRYRSSTNPLSTEITGAL